MRILILILLSALAVFAQQPGTVTVTSTIVATAGTITCTLSNPSPPSFTITCSSTVGTSGVTTSQTGTPAVGVTSGIVGSFNVASDAVTWIVKQESTGVVTWQVAANGVAKSGTF